MSIKKHNHIYLFLILFLIYSFIKHFVIDDLINAESAEIILKIAFSFLVIFLALRFRLLKPGFIKSNLGYAIIILGLLLLLAIIYVARTLGNHPDVSKKEHLLFLVNCLSTGLFEELLFRVFLFIGLYKITYKMDLNKFKRVVIMSSVVFASAHISNIFNPDYE